MTCLRHDPALRTAPGSRRGSCESRHDRARADRGLAGRADRGRRAAPGDRLPTEHDLAGWFGVSRMTLRHALAELAGHGLVTRTRGRRGGTFVAAPKLEQDLTTLAGFSGLWRWDGMVAASCAVRARAPACRPRPPPWHRGGRPGVRGPADPAGRWPPIALERSLFPAARFPGMLDFRLDGSLYELLEVRYGLRPHRARESLEPVTAGVREAEALGRGGGAADAGRADRLRPVRRAAGVRQGPVPPRPHPGRGVDLRAGRGGVGFR